MSKELTQQAIERAKEKYAVHLVDRTFDIDHLETLITDTVKMVEEKIRSLKKTKDAKVVDADGRELTDELGHKTVILVGYNLAVDDAIHVLTTPDNQTEV